MSTPNFFVGLDVHKDTVTIAVFRNRDPEPMRVIDSPTTRAYMTASRQDSHTVPV